MLHALEEIYLSMAEDIINGTMKAEAIVCKYCKSPFVWKYGRNRNNVQRYYCPNCDKVLLDNGALPRMSVSISQLGDVLGSYYGGMSLKELK
jgi:transposase-like protein